MNKLERKQLKDKKESRHNNLWVGMVTHEVYKSGNKSKRDQRNLRNQRDQLSYSMKEWDWKE